MSTEMIWQTSSTSSADTERLGELLGSKLVGGEVIELCSDLGGGKTTFSRGLARGAGSYDRVVSPTFTLNRVYRAKNFEIHHFDFYRLNNAGIMNEQLAESLQNPAAVTVVEWGDIVKDMLPKGRISIQFQPAANNSEERQITIHYPESSRAIIAGLESNWIEVEP